MAPLGLRKQPGGAEKRRKRKKIQEFVKSQANAMLKFLKKPETSSVTAQRNDFEGKDGIFQSKDDPEKEKDEVLHQSEQKKEQHLSEDMSDPGNWRNVVDTKMRDLLVEKGPATRLPSDYQFPKNANGRRFSHSLYIRDLVNGEKVNRQWLVYSKSLDKAFCFCCKLFRDDQTNGGGYLVTTGYNNWTNVSTRLKEHERSHDHMLLMTRWKMLEMGLQKNQTVDKLLNKL
ncbi:unnamed protein product [Microthlaspi erraticum]|uniref:TTF-type domain-containing protein n=1 Tax=Microthlaspi erraticum TaxID=1685480 RepID=A0A6D2I735_9BRAS|nr:unnamed protein product [Microthlaspi erraticum]CAA7022672.1 unnamed protein product [Microthlaspi erraticum]